jgi:hypothetical protein
MIQEGVQGSDRRRESMEKKARSAYSETRGREVQARYTSIHE